MLGVGDSKVDIRLHYSNISNFVSMQNLKLVTLKSYNCYVLMQSLLLVDT